MSTRPNSSAVYTAAEDYRKHIFDRKRYTDRWQ